MSTTYSNTPEGGTNLTKSMKGSALWAGLALALGVPTLLALFSPQSWFSDAGQTVGVAISELCFWLLALALLLLVRFGEHSPWSSMGLGKPRWASLGWGLVAGVVLLLLYPMVQGLLKAVGLDPSQMSSLDLKALPPWMVIGLALRAGIVEEVLFRGYLLERLGTLFDQRQLGALLSLIFFVAVHAKSWSAGHLIFVAIAGAMLTGLYLWRRDLWTNIVAHTLTDGLGLLALRFAPA
ncbi:CPBP family intramembrane glutamic endopeptidase [Shewanella sedimentimangrovi]|uniref:CPBP family intramembrane metalloprotease n=1 Tax=Shewanella sedimentimangrovi TaxID=2814293 RepID=A0ABX7R4B1_9GAMM|nr:CPBP family intramembrane glutamic endopeptidase [Shewanella sedimentimangrovi]QSX38669.1 CPBP family intramembrane metalloprotease [Shewanella sedimentimangrovi]